MADPKKVLHTSRGPAVAMDMTDERKERFSRVTGMIIDLCRSELPDPIEAYAVLKLCMEALGSSYDIRDSFMLKDGSKEKQ